MIQMQFQTSPHAKHHKPMGCDLHKENAPHPHLPIVKKSQLMACQAIALIKFGDFSST